MANKTTISTGLAWTDGKDTIRGSSALVVTQVGDNVIFNLQTIGTSAAEALDLGDVTPGYVFFKNEDETNFIEIGNTVGLSVVAAKLIPGQGVMIPTTTTAWFAKADTAPALLQVLAVDA